MEFDGLVDKALREKYFSYGNLTSEHAEMIVRDNMLTRFKIAEILESYRESGLWPADRLATVIDYLFDLKLQLYYLAEIDLGIYNRLYHGPMNEDPSLKDSPRLLLVRLSLDQNLIGKSRILWERIMNLVFYLETGKDLDSKKSKKTAFFNLIEASSRWNWLAPYAAVLTKYDDAFRTPEFHKHSVLRAVLMGSREVDSNDLLQLVNRATEILDNLRWVIRDGKPQSFSDLHLDENNEIDQRYL